MAALAPPAPPPVPAILDTMDEGPTPTPDHPGQAWLESHGRSLGHFVGGSWLKPPGRGYLEIWAGSDGRAVASAPEGAECDVAEAVRAAVGAAPEWGRLGGPQRGQRLLRLADALEGSPGVALGSLLSLVGAQPLCGTLGASLPLGLRLLRAPAGRAQLGPPGLEGWSPLGVVAMVVWEPCSAMALLWKLGPLLAMGNTVLVLCPHEAALPLLFLAELGGEGGALPPGVLNVVMGPPPELCQALRAHPDVAAITFLGAPQEQVQVLAWGSPCRGPRLQWAQGGRVVVIVLDSADLDSSAAAIAGALGASPALFSMRGCVVLAQEGVLAPLERRLRARLVGLRVGDPLNPRTDVGPLPLTAPSPQALVEAAREEGAEVFQPPLPPQLPVGRFYPPTLITGVAPTSRCLRELAEGPVLVLLPVRSPGEAVAVASALPLTAATSLWAQDITVALDTAERLPQGLVWLNALNLLDPNGGCATGARETSPEEALREFGCPPWEQPPKLDEPLSPEKDVLDPKDAELAEAMSAARAAALKWGRLPGASRAQVLRGAAEALRGTRGTPGDGDSGDTEGGLRRALLHWAAQLEQMGGALQEVPGGRALVRRGPVGVVGVAWCWHRPLALELLPPLLALGNSVVVTAPPGGLGPARHLRQVLVAAGLPGGALALLPGGSRGSGSKLARHHPDGLWLCGGDTDWASTVSIPHVWGVPAGILGSAGQDPPPDAEWELELRCTRPRCIWVPGGAP